MDRANSLNSYYASVFGCKRNIAQIKITRSGEPFTINIKMIRMRLAAIRRNKSMGPDGVPGEILKLGVEVMNPYLVRLWTNQLAMLLFQVTGKEPWCFPFTRVEIDR